jgi:geranylgeranyl diphosphate synthase type II
VYSCTRTMWKLVLPVTLAFCCIYGMRSTFILKSSKSSLGSSSTSFDLASYLAGKKGLIESALDLSLNPSNPNVSKLIESMRYSLLAGGKRIRPILCLATYEMLGGSAATSGVSVMPTAVALEMIHTMSLIHDDLPSMDNDALRRGKPTT